MWAARNGYLDIATELLDFGANLNPDDGSQHPISLALCGGHGDLVKLFIERGFGVNTPVNDGSTILTDLAMTAAFSTNEIDLPCRNNPNDTSVATAEFLLKAGADINFVTPMGTALMRAAFSGYTPLVELFCKQLKIRFDL